MSHALFLATPAYGGVVDVRYHESVLKLSSFCQQQQIALRHCFLTTASIITEARNELARQFLASDASHLLFIDADIGFSSSIVSKALRHNCDILCHPYPSKHIAWQHLLDNNTPQTAEQLQRAGLSYHIQLPETAFSINDGLTEVVHAPTGCMIIKRQVFERIMQQMPELQYQRRQSLDGQNHIVDLWGFFDLANDNNGHRLGEDYAFCARARATGSQLFADISEDISHMGKMEFRGKLMDKTHIA